MIELLLTSFPFALRWYWLRRRGLPIDLYALHHAIFAWFTLALIVFFTVFYYYPKSYTGIVTYRTVPVVAENGGDVTALHVGAGDRVRAGDPLFTVESSRERAAVVVARREVEEAERALDVARNEIRTAEAELSAAEAELAQAELTVTDQITLRDSGTGAFRANALERAETIRDTRIAAVAAATSRLAGVRLRAEEVLPATLETARANLAAAEADVSLTNIYAPLAGRIEQLTLQVGARAARLASRPSMVLVPDRTDDDPPEIAAGFAQVARPVLHVGMAAEVACESNFDIAMKNTVMPARITRIQGPIATGQLAPTGRLLEPAEFARRGEVVAFLALEHPEHVAQLVDGSGCMVQLYTTHVTGALEGTIIAHGIEALGVLKAFLLRMKVWIALAAGIGLGAGH